MKRGIIIPIMLALSLLTGSFEYLYVVSNTDVYLKMLDDADEKMAENEIYDAQSVAERLEHRYKNERKIYDIFLYHSNAQSIGENLAALSKYAATGETAEYFATSAVTRYKIESLRYSRFLTIDNLL